MDVIFKRTGERRYAVIVALASQPLKSMEPAPGYDDDIPHDLVHYVVEAELGLTSGVYGRAAQGGGTFISRADEHSSARERARARRKQQKREASLRQIDEGRGLDMSTSERLAAICDLAWRQRHGQTPDLTRARPVAAAAHERARVEPVLSRLDRLAPLWRALPVGGQLAFTWPSVEPK